MSHRKPMPMKQTGLRKASNAELYRRAIEAERTVVELRKLCGEAAKIIKHAAGTMYRPCYWHRVGIPGSGGDQWFRADVEYAMCFKRPGKLSWSDNTAMGHPPKWAPGGAMSHRLTDGQRRNQWGGTPASTGARRANGERRGHFRQSHRVHTKRGADGRLREQGYIAPAMANPGNLIRDKSGGGQIGDKMAHDNEAPFSERIAEWFVLSLCPPGGIVCDVFSGSGTTASVAKQTGRRFVASDVRMSQCELTRRRVSRAEVKLIA